MITAEIWGVEVDPGPFMKSPSHADCQSPLRASSRTLCRDPFRRIQSDDPRPPIPN
jgi:hypothetical protein